MMMTKNSTHNVRSTRPLFFFFNDTATTEIYTLSLHDALPIYEDGAHDAAANTLFNLSHLGCTIPPNADTYWLGDADRKSTRLNSSHANISYAVFCLKKKKRKTSTIAYI